MNFEDYSYDGNEYAFTIVDEKQPIVSVSFGGVDSGASCNVIDRQLWESLKQNNMKCVSSSHKKQLYPYGSKEPLKTSGCFTAKITVEDVVVEAEFTVIEGKGQALLRRDADEESQSKRLC